jgi:hypothetical protein
MNLNYNTPEQQKVVDLLWRVSKALQKAERAALQLPNNWRDLSACRTLADQVDLRMLEKIRALLSAAPSEPNPPLATTPTD